MANRPLVLLVTAAVLAGAGLLAFGATRYTSDDLRVLITIAILGAIAERYAVGLFHSDVSMGVAAVLTAAVIAGPWGVAIVAPPIVLAGQLRTEVPLYKRAYNVAVYTLAGGAFAAVFLAFDMRAAPDDWPQLIAPALIGAAANFVVNTGLVAAAVALGDGESIRDRWNETYLWLAPHFLAIGLTATAAATAAQIMGVWGLAVFAVPFLTIRQGIENGAKGLPFHDDQLRRAA